MSATLPGRECLVCDCDQVAVVSPGTAPLYAEIGFRRVLVQPGRPDLSLCLACAVRIGWPWPSERRSEQKRRRLP